MEGKTKIRRFSAELDWSMIVVFLVLIVIPLIAQVLSWTGNREIEWVEFRKPSPFPSWPTGIQSVQEYPGEMDAFLDDHFGFRSWLAVLDSSVRLLIGSSGSDKVLVGKDGWLFFNRKRTVDEHRGTIRFADRKIDIWVEGMEEIRMWLERRSIHLMLVVFPTKCEIYPEYLPTWAQPIGRTRFEVLVDRIRSTTSIDLVDTKPLLIDAKSRSDQPLYFKTDTHWTGRGAVIAYEAMMKSIIARFPNAHIAEQEVDYRLEPMPSPGDLRRVMNVRWGHDEPPLDRIRPISSDTFLSSKEMVNGQWTPCPAYEVGLKRDNTAYLDTTRTKAPRVLLFRDSFTIEMDTLLKNSFSSVMFTLNKGMTLNGALVESFDPDIVVFAVIDNALLYFPSFEAGVPLFADSFATGDLTAWSGSRTSAKASRPGSKGGPR